MSLPLTYFILRPIKLNTDNSVTTRVTLKLTIQLERDLKVRKLGALYCTCSLVNALVVLNFCRLGKQEEVVKYIKW
jgi:hypothetical protein